MDLHAWITQQVDKVEAAAHDAGSKAWHWEHDYGDMCNDPTCPYGELATDDAVLMQVHGYDVTEPWQGAAHIQLHHPAAVLRRCETDRRILAQHKPQPNGTGFEDGWQCQTCSVDGGDGYQYLVPYPCPTVEDLAHAHGITPDVLAGLDHPRAPESKMRITNERSLADVLRIATPPITTSDVPEALRGPHWKP